MTTENTPLIQGLPLIGQGKVRDIYEVDAKHLLIHTTDRMSAYDVILPDLIPGKGRVLNLVSEFWMNNTTHIIPNHLSTISLWSVLSSADDIARLGGSATVVKKLTPLPVEAIVRGYIIGSGWSDYQNTGKICGIELPEGLLKAQELPRPIYTPSTKAALGEHDENISFEKTMNILGIELATQVRDVSLALYAYGQKVMKTHNIIVADTKFEFGIDDDGVLHLIDEALTPDSSRFWPMCNYEVGMNPPSYDKQFLRDHLESTGWDKTEPGPKLPANVITVTSQKYLSLLSKVLGRG